MEAALKLFRLADLAVVAFEYDRDKLGLFCVGVDLGRDGVYRRALLASFVVTFSTMFGAMY